VLDLTARPGVDWRETVHVVARWVHRRVVTVDEIPAELTLRQRHPQRRVVLAPGLPRPTLQARAVHGGQRVRHDAEWEEYGVILESDGLLAHGAESIHRDRRRDRQAARTGRVTLRAGYADIEFAPCQLAVDLHETLRVRGYRDGISACRPGCIATRRATA
jgi:hypothetical protein